jgi:hypothetical protein
LAAAAHELPYLVDIAQLDRCWTEAHLSPPTRRRCTPHGWLAAIAAEAPKRCTRLVHPAAPGHALALVRAAPAFTICRAMPRASGVSLRRLHWQAEGALLTRPRGAVQWAPLPHAGCALLDACAAGATFEDAAAQALQADPAADLPALVALLLRTGALRAPEPC